MKRLLVGIAAAVLGLALAAGLASAAGRPGSPGAAEYKCSGADVTVFDNYNGGAVSGGGTSPSFTTKGKAYCLVWIQTYHYNNGKGTRPGKLGLTGTTTVKLRKASKAPGENWIVNFSTTKPVVIHGRYSCNDSSPKTWSQDSQSKGKGFCYVEGVSAKK